MKTFYLMGAVVLGLAGTMTAASAKADTISNPNGGSSVAPLCGWPYQGGGCQVTFIGESFGAAITGNLTDLQFTLLGGSNLTQVQAVVYELNGPLVGTYTPGAELWRSAAVAGTTAADTAKTFTFNPANLSVTAGKNYVAFLTTYFTASTGSASVSSCSVFIGSDACKASNLNPQLGRAITGRVEGANLDELVFNQVVNGSQDLTFSATITPAAVPEPASWAMMIAGFGVIGAAARRRRTNVSFA